MTDPLPSQVQYFVEQWSAAPTLVPNTPEDITLWRVEWTGPSRYVNTHPQPTTYLRWVAFHDTTWAGTRETRKAALEAAEYHRDHYVKES